MPNTPEMQRAQAQEIDTPGMTPPAETNIAAGVDALLDLLDLEPSSTATGPASTPNHEPEPRPAEGGAPSTASPAKAPSSVHGAPSGEHFVTWLREGIQVRKLIINDAKALVHTVADTAYLVSPGVFQRYAQEHPQVAAMAKQDDVEGWQWVQKRFEKLALHRKHASGLNIWTCEVTGPRKSRRLHGYLLQTPNCLFAEPPPNNPFLRVDEKSP
jgi:hypothetical protein